MSTTQKFRDGSHLNVLFSYETRMEVGFFRLRGLRRLLPTPGLGQYYVITITTTNRVIPISARNRKGLTITISV